METKIQELKILCELEMSILNDGKITTDEIGCFASKEDEQRLKGLYSIQDKYHYGWYIARDTFKEQLLGINEFKKYILEQ